MAMTRYILALTLVLLALAPVRAASAPISVSFVPDPVRVGRWHLTWTLPAGTTAWTVTQCDPDSACALMVTGGRPTTMRAELIAPQSGTRYQLQATISGTAVETTLATIPPYRAALPVIGRE
jgi:hypothetical protein